MCKFHENFHFWKDRRANRMTEERCTEEWTERWTGGQRDPNKPRQTFQP